MSERPGSEYVSNHDRGAFGELLARAKAAGVYLVDFSVYLDRGPEDMMRWTAYAYAERHNVDARPQHERHGRTGEEALRRLVEALEGDPVALATGLR